MYVDLDVPVFGVNKDILWQIMQELEYFPLTMRASFSMNRTSSEVIKLFSCSTQLSMKF